MDDDGVSALPEHLQLEVFSRVGDVKALFRFAVTCRGWLRRFTDAAFLRELCPGSSHGSGGRHRARLLGVFVQDKRFRYFNEAMVQARMAAAPPQQRASSSAPVFLPALGSPLGPAGRALTSFAGGGDDDDDGTFDYAEPLAARRGIVLVKLAPRTPEEMKRRCHLFAVCNPITGDRHVLPPLDSSLAGRILLSFAIVTAADVDDSRSSEGGGDHDRPPAASPAAARWTFSKLLVITRHEDRGWWARGEQDEHACLSSYSAATRSWSPPTRCMNTRVVSLVGPESAVVHGGAAHWMYGHVPRDDGGGGEHHQRLYRLSVEVATATARVSWTRLPVRIGGHQLLCVNGEDDDDEQLAVASVYRLHVSVWTPPPPAGDEDDDDDDDDDTTPAAVAWPRTSFRIAPQLHELERWCNFSHGSLLVLFRDSGGVLILDLDTKVMEEVLVLDFDEKAMDPSGAYRLRWHRFPSCVPYEMDLLEFFTLQLGGIRQRLVSETE